MTFLSDGGETVRDLQLYLNLQAEHILDWFHVAMRVTVLQQIAKGLPQTTSDGEETYELRDPMIRSLERLKWSPFRLTKTPDCRPEAARLRNVAATDSTALCKSTS